MREAAAGGAELCAFPETFLSGYPVWLDLTDAAKFEDADQKRAYAAYVSAAVDADGPELKAIRRRSRLPRHLRLPRDHRTLSLRRIGLLRLRGDSSRARDREHPSQNSCRPTASVSSGATGDANGPPGSTIGKISASAASTAGRIGCPSPAIRSTRRAKPFISPVGRAPLS